MTVHFFLNILDKILNESLLQSFDINTQKKNESAIDTSVKHALTNVDFVRFLLNFLRESAAPVLGSIDNESCEAGVQLNPDKSEIFRKDNVKVQVATSRKIRENTEMVDSRSHYNVTLPFPRSTSHISQLQNSPRPEQRRQFTKQSSKPRREPINLSEFLSPEGGSFSHSSMKKRSGKKGKRVPLNTTAEGKTRYCGGDEYHHQFNQTVVGHMANIRSSTNLQSSEASKSMSFNSEEDFPSLSDSNAAKINGAKPSRRIKPTLVNVSSTPQPSNDSSRNTAEGDAVNSCVNGDYATRANPFMTTAVSTTPSCELKNEKDLLLKMKNSSKTSCDIEGSVLQPRANEVHHVTKDIGNFSPGQILEQGKLDRLCQLYCYFLNCFMVPNIISELQFVMDLLSAHFNQRKNETTAVSSSSITGTLHNYVEQRKGHAETGTLKNSDLLSFVPNCIHFAVHVIQSLTQSNFICILTRSSLASLLQNQRIQAFLPSLQSQLQNLISRLESRDKDPVLEMHGPRGQNEALSSVMFEAETDDRSNFPTDKSFHAFRRHRDMFYVILREYRERKNDPNFKMQENLSNKIKHFVCQVKSFGTFKPFVRLFVSQMLQEISEHGSITTSADVSFSSEYVHSGRTDLLTKLRHGDPEKFKRLQSRFYKSNSEVISEDLLSDRCFFYKEFVSCTDSYTFNTFLCNELRDRISDVESQQVQRVLDNVLMETTNTLTISTTLVKMITAARLLGSFLGYIVFEPFNAEECSDLICDSSLYEYADSAVQRATSNNHELITIPWVVEYLKYGKCSSSPSSVKLKTVLESLFFILRKRVFCDGETISISDLYLSLLITNLFEMLPHPEDILHSLLKQHKHLSYMPKCLKLTGNEIQQEAENPLLDSCCADLIDSTVVSNSFPSLGEIRSAIIACNTGALKTKRSQVPSRKIKPNTEKEEDLSEKKEKYLQNTLEEHFFRGQPSSLKRTVEFVAERCASNCVKHIRSVSMLDVCNEAEKTCLQKIQTSQEVDVSNQAIKTSIVKDIVHQMKSYAKQRMHQECHQFCEKAVPQCLDDLSSCETAKGVLKIATTIALRKTISSVHSWLSSRLDELVSMSVKARLTKVFMSVTETGQPNYMSEMPDWLSSCTDSLPSVESISSLLQIMKEFAARMTFRTEPGICVMTISPTMPEEINIEDVAGLLKLAHYLLERNHPNPEKNPMLRVLKSSPHLKNALRLMAQELLARASIYFKRLN